nr:energy-coupling factor ABC transporter ATP-binding protein [Candidatus Bathyarchaeota archaeon]
GKTTLAKLICGLLKPVKGRVLVKGCDTRKMSVSKVSESVSLVFQNPILQIFTSSVEDELKLALVTRGFPEELIHERVEEVIRLLDLEECRFKDPYRLSRGEQQRVITGAVMTVKPEVIVLDEPTTGQDVPRRIKMIKYLKDLTLLGITVILVTHDVELTPYCSRLIVLGNGGVLADGEPREILYNMDLLENAGLKPPQLVRLAIRMQDDTNPVTLDEMAQSILSRLPKAMVET